MRPIKLLTIGLAALAVLLLPALALANSAPPRFTGDTGGLLLPGTSNQVHIKGEVLAFELTEELGAAQVTARYLMENSGAALSSMPVVFAIQDSESSADVVEVTWNGQPLAVAPVDLTGMSAGQQEQVNQAWTATDKLIDPVSGEPYESPEYFGHSSLKLVQFELDMAAGATGALEVRYHHDAAQDRVRHANSVYHYQYLLLPARNWASFGPLEIQVKVPGKAFFQSNLPLALAEGEYRGRFDTLPQENLVFGVMSRKGLIGDMADTGPYYMMAFVLFLVLAGLLGWGLGWLCGAIRKRGWAIGTAVAVALLGGGLVDFLLAFLAMGLFPALDNDGYGRLFIAVGQWLLAVPLTTVVAGIKAARRHRAKWGAGAPAADRVS